MSINANASVKGVDTCTIWYMTSILRREKEWTARGPLASPRAKRFRGKRGEKAYMPAFVMHVFVGLVTDVTFEKN